MSAADIVARADEALSRPTQENASGKCVCTDSVRSSVGTCPDRYDREFYCCPNRAGIFDVREVL